MRKRRIYLALLILAVAGLVGLIVAGAFREREPEYGGKKLSEWLQPTIVTSNSLGERVVFWMPEDSMRAIPRMGTSTVPFLLKWIEYEPPAWKTRLLRTANESLHWNLEDKRQHRAQAARSAFMILQERAGSAIPALAVLMKDTCKTNTAARAAQAWSAVDLAVRRIDRLNAPEVSIDSSKLERATP